MKLPGVIMGETTLEKMAEEARLMWKEFSVVGGSVLTLFFMMAVGFFLGKRGMLSKDTLAQMSRLLLCVVAPAIMIDTLLGEERSGETVQGLLIAGGVLVGTYVLYMLLIHPCFPRQGEDRGVLRFASIYGNTGFMGIPLIQTVLGEEAMLPTVVSLAVFNIATWTHGNSLIGGRRQLSVKRTVLNPGVVGFAVALALFAVGVKLPEPISAAVGYVGDLNTPLAMVVIGGQMAAVNWKDVFGDRRVYAVSALKLLAVPALTMAVLLPFRLDPMTYMAVVILSGCPVAGATGLFSQMNGKDTSLAARAVTLSTVLCIVTLPLVTVAARLMSGI